jgi:hypothetical protein
MLDSLPLRVYTDTPNRGGSTGGGTFTPGSGEVVEERSDAPSNVADPPPTFSIVPGGTTIVTPGGGSAGPVYPSPSNVWTIGPGSTTVTHG